jgi:hypothetical protein
MNSDKFNPYRYFTIFGSAAIVTGLVVPALSGPMAPNPATWLVVITGTAVSVVAAVRWAISAQGILKIVGTIATLAALWWLAVLFLAITDM